MQMRRYSPQVLSAYCKNVLTAPEGDWVYLYQPDG